MKQLKNTSVSRIALLTLVSCFVDSLLLKLLICIYLLLKNFRESIIYVILVILIFINTNYRTDFIKYGLVEYKNNNYYVVNKVLYKVKVYSDDIKIGDIILTKSNTKSNEESNLNKNILFICDDVQTIIYTFKIKNRIDNRINNLDDQSKGLVKKYLYNNYDYDTLKYNLGYGLSIYYLIKYLFTKNRKIGYTLLTIYSLLFYFDCKFILIILKDIFRKKTDRNYYVLLLILIINYNLLKNESFKFIFLLSIYQSINVPLDYKCYFLVIESYLFGYIDILRSFLYKYIIYYEIILLLLSLLRIYFSNIETIYFTCINLLSVINNITFEIRGTLSIGSLLLFVILLKRKKHTKYKEYIVLCLLLLNPLNNPFMYVKYIDVGQGDSILIHTPFGCKNILIDTGSSYSYYKLSKTLKRDSVYKIDYLIITHSDEDHNGNISNLKNDFKIGKIIEIGEDIELNTIKLSYLKTGKYDNDNDNSLVYWTNINDIAFLFTGDISSNVDRVIENLYSYMKIDVLKVSHHGSNTGTSLDFLYKYHPKFAIISTSGKYNHPSIEVVNNLKECNVNYYITKTSGNITIYLTKLMNLLKTDNGDFVIIESNDISY